MTEGRSTIADGARLGCGCIIAIVVAIGVVVFLALGGLGLLVGAAALRHEEQQRVESGR